MKYILFILFVLLVFSCNEKEIVNVYPINFKQNENKISNLIVEDFFKHIDSSLIDQDGKYILYYSDSLNLFSEFNVINRLLDGSYKIYYKKNNKIRAVGKFFLGRAAGRYLECFSSGRLKTEGFFSHCLSCNIVDSLFFHSPDSFYYRLVAKPNFLTRDSIWKEYYENGNIKSEIYYKNCTVYGVSRNWLESGELNQATIHYNNSNVDKLNIVLNEQGDTILTEIFIKGKSMIINGDTLSKYDYFFQKYFNKKAIINDNNSGNKGDSSNYQLINDLEMDF